MSTRQTTVGELTAADLGKWVEVDREVCSGRLQEIHHTYGVSTMRLDGDAGSKGSLFEAVLGNRGYHRNRRCLISHPEPLDPAVRVRDKNGEIYARIGDHWVSENCIFAWGDLDDPVVVES